MNDSTYHRARFTIDDAAVFEGWTDGSEWNGWACPYFEHEAARNIAAYHGGSYDENTREFRFEKDRDEPEAYPAETIEVDNREIEVWAIGNGLWIWDEVGE